MASIRQKNGSKRWTATIRVPKDIQDINPEFIRKKNGAPKSLLERALGTQDEKLARKLAADFERECDSRFEYARSSTPSSVSPTKSAEQAMTKVVETLQQVVQAQEQNPEAVTEWLRSKLVAKLDRSNFSPADPRVSKMFDEVSKGITAEVSDGIVKLASAVHYPELTFEQLAEIDRYKREARDTRVSVGVVFSRYIRKRVGDAPIKSSTIQRAKKTFNDFCSSLPFGEATAADSITVAQVREWVADYQIKHQEQGLSLTTVRNKIDSIAPAFNKAVDDELITRNPFRNFSEAFYQTKRGVKTAEANRSWINDELSDSALLNLIRACSQKFRPDSRSPGHRSLMPLIGLALYTGARIEELCRLTPADIKLRKHLNVRYIDITAAKSQAGIREVPLLPLAELIIDKLIAETKSSNDYLFPDLPIRDGRRSHNPSNEFSRFKHSLGYTLKNEYTFHSFRSTVVTLLDRGDVKDSYISMMIGHTEGRKTLAKRTYSAGQNLAKLKESVSVIKYRDDIEQILKSSLDL